MRYAMKKFSVFFSEQNRGWEQAIIPSSLQECDYDSLVNWAAWQTRQQGLKGFLVSENPNPFPLLKRRARANERQKGRGLNELNSPVSIHNGRLHELVNIQEEEEAYGRIAV
jgi:hypothetical protein